MSDEQLPPEETPVEELPPIYYLYDIATGKYMGGGVTRIETPEIHWTHDAPPEYDAFTQMPYWDTEVIKWRLETIAI